MQLASTLPRADSSQNDSYATSTVVESSHPRSMLHTLSYDEADSPMADGLQRADDLQSQCDENRRASTSTESNLKQMIHTFCSFHTTSWIAASSRQPPGRHSTESGRYYTSEATRSPPTSSAVRRGSKQPRHMVDLVLWHHTVASRKKKLCAIPAPRPMWASALSMHSTHFLKMFSQWQTLTWAAQGTVARGSNSFCIASCS